MDRLLKRFILVALAAMTLVGCGKKDPENDDKFTYWVKESAALNQLVDYVDDVTDEKSQNFIPVEDRIAVFDMDGTLYGEKAPIYIEWLMYVHRVKEDSTYNATEEQIQVADMIVEAINTGSIPEELESKQAICNAQVYKNMTIEEYTAYAKKFVDRNAELFNNIKYSEMWYKPMLQVVDYLNEHNFTVYMCSGTDRFLCRMLADGKVNIVPQRIIGSDVWVEASGQAGKAGLEYEYTKNDKVVRTGELIVKNVKANKVPQIQQEIGKKPVLSFGNSSGDTSMARFVMDDNKYRSLAFMVVADDTVRENGNIEKAAAIKEKWLNHGFIPISMKDDWNTIYGDNVTRSK